MPYAPRRSYTYKRSSARTTRSSSYKRRTPSSSYKRRYTPTRTTSYKYKPSATRPSYRRYTPKTVAPTPAVAPVSGGKTWDRNVKRANDVISIAGRFMPLDLKKDTAYIAQGVGRAIGNVKVDAGKIIGKIFHL